jgi:UDP-N-acetylglucosamine transferase subunit ALG13
LKKGKDMEKGRRILFAISSLGLGHATRTTAVIEHFRDTCDITVVSHGNTLEFLKKELGGEGVEFVPFDDYPGLERGTGLRFYFYLVADLIKTNLIIKKERQKVLELEDNFDFIFSDGKYGFYSSKIPSFLLSHQLSFIPPKGLASFRFLSDIANYLYFKNFDIVFVPDFEDADHSLAGKLSHPKFLKFLRHQFIGLLSSYKKIDMPEDLDYLFIISGYLHEHKEGFVSQLIEQAKGIDGKKAFILGNAAASEVVTMKEFDITIYPLAQSSFRNELMNRAKVVISRTGYTTILDLVELNKKGILFATPNQSEQEYLAEFFSSKNYFVIGEDEKNFDLQKLIFKLAGTGEFPTREKTAEALQKIDDTINSFIHENFFSIVIPAYNEEGYLPRTLDYISGLDYDAFEVIVVENGSTDNTYEVADGYRGKMANLKVIKSPPGVSVAKNQGLDAARDNSDWVIFLDADTILKRDFLKYLNGYLNKNRDLSVGTCAIQPLESKSLYDRLWFGFYDKVHKYLKTSYSLQLAKAKTARKVKFDVELNYSEDLKFIRDMQACGNFFFFDTDQVFTSTRRFRKDGYFGTLFYWVVQALTPKLIKKKRKYRSIR